MSGAAAKPMTALPQPEPGLTPETIIARAAALRETLRREQDESDWRGHYSEGVHKQLLDGGFYRILQPKAFGGYEFDPRTFIRVIMEISRGHPGAGWCFTLGASHGYLIASHWPIEAQRALFGSTGDFRSPAVGVPAGTMKKVDGGYVVTGTWPFGSGVPYATHFIGSSFAAGSDGELRRVMLITPRENVEILDDWGKDQYFGMQASGSNTVKLTDVFVPDQFVVAGNYETGTEHMKDGTPGTRHHKNPIYLCITTGWFNTEFAAILSGTARAALDEFADVALSKRQLLNPQAKMKDDPFVQHDYGRAIALADAAEALTLAAVDLYTEQCKAYFSERKQITMRDSFKVWGMASEAARLAGEAVEILFHQSGGSTGRRGRKLQRYFKDIETYRIHPQALPLIPALRGQAEFGMPVAIFGNLAPKAV